MAFKAHAEVASLLEAVTEFQKIEENNSAFTVFRGHADFGWPMKPSLLRNSKSLAASEYHLVREIHSRYPADFANDTTMFDRLVRMQHFSMPTRLLDVTINPLIALYFSVDDPKMDDIDGAVVFSQGPKDRIKYYDSDAVSCISNLANLTEEEREIIEQTPARNVAEFNKINPVDRLYQFIRVEKLHFRKAIKKIDLFKPYLVIPKMSNKRLIAQHGRFFIKGLDQQNGPEFDRTIKHRRIKVISSAKSDIRRALAKMGYDDSTLFPEIDRAAKEITRRYSEV